MGNVFLRTVILYLFVIFGMRLMGKRQIGELQPSDLVVTIMISDVASIALQSTNIPFLFGIIPVLTLVSLEIILSYFSLKSCRFRRIISGSPCLVIMDGQIDQDEMRKLRLNVDDIFEALRMNKIKKLSDVKYGFVETNGQLSIMPTASASPASAKDEGLSPPEDSRVPLILIKDGQVEKSQLDSSGKNKDWLCQTLKENGQDSPKNVFLFVLNGDESITIIPKCGFVNTAG